MDFDAMCEYYTEANQTKFNGGLPEVGDLELEEIEYPLGPCTTVYRRDGGWVIQLRDDLHDGKCKQSILHGMCHVYLGHNAHDDMFQGLAKQVGLSKDFWVELDTSGRFFDLVKPWEPALGKLRRSRKPKGRR